VSNHYKAKWSVYLPHDIALLNRLFCHTFSGCICCYAAHTECPLFLKRILIVAQSVCPLRHGKRNFQYYLAVKRKTCCGVVIFCYPDCWIKVVTQPEGPGTGRPSRHWLDYFVFLCLQADTQMVPKMPSCYCMHIKNIFSI